MVMNKKRKVFMCRLPLVNYVILGIMAAVLVPFAVWSILRIAEVGTFYSVNPTFDVIALVAEVLVTAFIVALTLLTRYVVTPKHFVVQRIVATKIPVDKLLLLRHEMSENMLVLYFADARAPEGVRFVVLRVFNKQMQAIVAAIQEVNPHVSYEMFDNSRKDGDD